MTKEELDKFEKELSEKGYTKYHYPIKDRYKYYWSKSIRKYVNDTENNADCLINYEVWDFSEYAYIDENLRTNPYSIEIELYLDSVMKKCDYFRPLIQTDMSIDEVEEMVDSLIEWGRNYCSK